MIDVSISTAESGAKKVRLGKQGENGVRKIIFDLQSMVNRYGDGLATLVFQRNGDTAPYVVTATREENSLVWIVTSTDTAKAGQGRAEIRWFVDGALAKTVIFATETIASIVEDTEMPDVMQTWYDQMIDYVDAQPQIVIGEVQRMIDGKADTATVDNVYAKKTDIPTKLSKFTNDAGFITEIPEEYVTDAELEDVRSSLSAMIGSPLVAASAAEMTDTGRVYVYTGAETGYENGDWYYYDSGISQWRSGGVYNSTAVTTDKTLSVENSAADAKATGDAIDSLNEDITNLQTGKQDALTFDQVPTNESTNPVTSVGIKSAIEAAVNVTAPGIYETAPGSIASFTDGADDLPMKSCVVNIEPIQEGEGDPSPENVRPIRGRTGLQITRTATNLFNVTALPITHAGVTYTLNTDGSVHAKGIFSRESNSFVALGTVALPVGNYILTGSSENSVSKGYQLQLVTASPVTTIGYDNGTGLSFSVTEPTLYTVRILIRSAQAYNQDVDITLFPMISVKNSEFVKYNGEIININWESEAGTVYGGTLDVVSGKLTITHKGVVLNGSEDWARVTGTYNYCRLQINDSLVSNYGICDRFPRVVIASTTNYQGFNAYYSSAANAYYIGIRYDDIFSDGDIDSLKTWLSQNNITVVYRLLSPIEYQLTPQEIRTLLGTNNIWSDGGDTEVEYPADTKLYIQRLTGSDEDDMVANSNIPDATYFLINNTLYKSTAAIASGDPIVPGTNCTVTNLAEALNALNTTT